MGQTQSFGHLGGLGEVRFRQEEQQLFSAIAGKDIHTPRFASQAIGDLPQDSISGGVAVGVVDSLEMIQVYHQCGEGACKAGGPGELSLAKLDQAPPIVEARQFINHHQLLDLGVQPGILQGDGGSQARRGQEGGKDHGDWGKGPGHR